MFAQPTLDFSDHTDLGVFIPKIYDIHEHNVTTEDIVLIQATCRSKRHFAIAISIKTWAMADEAGMEQRQHRIPRHRERGIFWMLLMREL